MIHYLRALRPVQWSKNILVFAGIVFSESLFDLHAIKLVVIAFIAFSLTSSSGYLINDVIDRKKDELHPKKKKRPIASGKIAPQSAVIVALGLMILAYTISFIHDTTFSLVLVGYFLMTIAYSMGLKRVIILDVLIIAMGFMLRTIGGIVIIHAPISSWLIICTTFLALFIAVSKRKAEMLNMKDQSSATRKTLEKYSPQLLDHMITTMTSASLISFALYTLDDQTIAKFQTRALVFTIPFVIYAIFRYLYLVYSSDGGESPELLFLQDVPLFLCILLYVVSTALIIYLL